MSDALDDVDVINGAGPSEAAPLRPRRLEVLLPILIVACDQISKAIVLATLSIHQSVTVVPGFVDFTHVRNSGAAFGILNYADFPFKTAIIAIVAALPLTVSICG